MKRIYRKWLAMALRHKALRRRHAMDIPIIAITGSNGKTTTKELINAVLSTKYRTSATRGNLNNHIGVPRTLLSMPSDTEVGIVEMGANHIGEIAMLCRTALPTLGLITNAGRAHLDGFGSLEGVKRAKAELYGYLAYSGGTALVNIDDSVLMEMVERSGLRRCEGYSAELLGVKVLPQGDSPYLRFEYGGKEITTHFIGRYNIANICAAIAVGQRFGVTDDAIINAISGYIPTNARSELRHTAHNHIIADCYNANPASMAASIENFIGIKAERKCIILGEMLELGAHSRSEHLAIAEMAAASDTDKIFLVGREFVRLGLLLPTFADADALIEHIRHQPLSGYTILIKGSNGVRLEKVLQSL